MRLNFKNIHVHVAVLLFALTAPLYSTARSAAPEAGTVTTLEEFRQMALEKNKQHISRHSTLPADIFTIRKKSTC